MTLTATPIGKDKHAVQETKERSGNRVDSPMLKKEKMKVQVRSDTSGASTLGRTVLLKSAVLKPLVKALMSSEAAKKPMTNFGNRHHTSRASGARPVWPFSHTKVAIAANTTDQMPIHRSRPITFISVNDLIAASSAPTIFP